MSEQDIAVDRIREAAEPNEERYAIAGRKLEFRSGPENYTFHACREHLPYLETGDVTCFFAVPSQPVFDVSADDEIECDFCREP